MTQDPYLAPALEALPPTGQATAWRDGDVVVWTRDEPLPPFCVLSGEPATRHVSCIFHWQDQPLAATGPLGLLRHYLLNVSKARLNVPLADQLLRRRRYGWFLFGMTAVLAAATVMALVFGQRYISAMPAGLNKSWWNDIGIPAVALGGFLFTGVSALLSYKIMPMPTARLKPLRITSTHVWLNGAAPEYIARLPAL